MTEEDAPRATPTKKLFTNFKVYMQKDSKNYTVIIQP